MKDIYLIIPLIVSALSITSLAIISESSNINTNQCSANSLEEIEPKFPVKEPKYLPEGYKLRVVDDRSWDPLNPGRIIVMNYDIEDLCHAKLFGILGSTIAIAAIDINHPESSKIENPMEYFSKTAESYNAMIPETASLIEKPEDSMNKVKIIKINSYIGIAREPSSKGYNVYIIDGKEKVVVENDNVYQGFIMFYHENDKVLYQIRSSYSVEEMIRIAESIP